MNIEEKINDIKGRIVHCKEIPDSKFVLLNMSIDEVFNDFKSLLQQREEKAQHDLVDRYEEKIQSKVPELRKLIK